MNHALNLGRSLKNRRSRTPRRKLARGAQRRRLQLEPLEDRNLMAILVSEALSGTADTSIQGTVYEDLNSNGSKDPGEDGLADWTVYLDLDNSGTRNRDTAGVDEPAATTNGDGEFRFRFLKPYTYRISQEVPFGYRSTGPNSRDIAVEQGKDARADFFNFAGGEIFGTVWNDLNDDGERAIDEITGDFIEPGLVAWEMFLDLNDNQVLDPDDPVTQTDSRGEYTFTDLPPGDYEVMEVLPSDWEPAKGFDFRQTAKVQATQRTLLDFANLNLIGGSLRGQVWQDANLDGIRDVDPDTGDYREPGLADWTVFLDLNGNQSLDLDEPSATTDGSGQYSFLSLPAGDYTLVEVLPDGWSVSPEFDAQQMVTIEVGKETIADDFANFSVANGSLRGVMWNDVNRNGVRDTALDGSFLEPGISGWTVFLDLNQNGVQDLAEPTAITAADGSYQFADLQVGEYKVRELLPAGWETAPLFDDNYSVELFSGTETLVPDFANYNLDAVLPGSVRGTLWNDANGNGVRDVDSLSGEFTDTGLSGWIVYVDSDNNGAFDPSEPQATTAADGTYSIGPLTPGSVTIAVQVPAGWRATSPRTGRLTFALRNDDQRTDVDFGVEQRKEAIIGGTVFADSNRNGVRNEGESGIKEVVVYLDLDADATLDPDEPQTATSADLFYTPAADESGSYRFTHLAPGTYTVRVVVPPVLAATPADQLVHTVTVGAAEELVNVDTAAVYRRNEIHGMRFDDANGNHLRDPEEPGVAGITVYVDLDRDDVLDAEEPRTETREDGSYSFVDLSPGSYVVREVLSSEYEPTYPETVGGILWPEGTSNPAWGQVDPLSITTSLANGETHRQTVSISLPNSGALTNLVDVFLLFDDTGSFVNNSPLVRAAFPDIIASLQTSLTGIDLGFGVGRFEEYANFAFEYGTGRPFILNQPIVAASTPGYLEAIQAALDRTTPGYGGDEPETDIEALYQLVTGLGYDGNDNGSVLDSGPAGLASTQTNPGESGDVPSFASFRSDPTSSVLAPAGNIGGAGFRAGALPIILVATDTGFAFEPRGESIVQGTGGVSLPISQLTSTSRPNTPFGTGAGIQQTVTALNALGAMVIGLGTNPEPNADPRQGLEGLSQLTGAINRSTNILDNGTGDPIGPGDPLYFQIASGFAGSVAQGVVNAIQSAVTSVAVNIDVRASDPRVKIVNHSGVAANVGAGQTASFDIEFTGDGAPHRFDLQFVRAGTNVVLGSIPVVLGTPIPGDGYCFEELEDGEIETHGDFGARIATSVWVNSAPTFSPGINQSIQEDAERQVITGWATDIRSGPEADAGQTVIFVVSCDLPQLFLELPAIGPDGTLTFKPAANASGTATVTVSLHDDGGIENGGVDTSAPYQFTITISEVNDAPTDLTLAQSPVPEHLTGRIVGTLSVADVDVGQSHEFTVSDSRFEVVGNTLKLCDDQELDLEPAMTISLDVTATDSGTPTRSLTATFVIQILANPRPWQNSSRQLDSDGDGIIAPIDVLLIINLLNAPGTVLGSGGELPTARAAITDDPYYDTSGDGFCTAIDALLVINHLNGADGEGELAAAMSGLEFALSGANAKRRLFA